MGVTAATMATVTAITALAGTAVSAYSAIQQGNAAKDQASAQAKAMEMEGQLNDLNARAAAAEHQKEAARMQAAQISSAAGVGVSLNSESLLTIMQDTANKYNKDIAQMRRTGRLGMAGQTYSANAARAGGRASQSGSWLNAGGSLLTGISTAIPYADKGGWFE